MRHTLAQIPANNPGVSAGGDPASEIGMGNRIATVYTRSMIVIRWEIAAV